MNVKFPKEWESIRYVLVKRYGKALHLGIQSMTKVTLTEGGPHGVKFILLEANLNLKVEIDLKHSCIL